jgi:hypothetical protein
METLAKELESVTDFSNPVALEALCVSVAERFRQINSPKDQSPEKAKVIELLRTYRTRIDERKANE